MESVCLVSFVRFTKQNNNLAEAGLCLLRSLVRERRRGGEEDGTRTRHRHGAAITLV
jgi:hypothetical protein